MSKATGCCFCGHNRRQERSDYCATCEHKLWTDPTPLTLDVLRQELGEPNRVQEECGEASWLVSKPISDRWFEWIRDVCTFRGMGCIRTLGQLRRILSVIREQEG